MVAMSSFASFTFISLSIIINSLFISWRGMAVFFRTVSYAATRRRMFLDGYWVIPFARIITMGSFVLVVSNFIVASVSSAIWLMHFEDVWMEATHACVFVIMLGGLRGGWRVLSKAVPNGVVGWYREGFPCLNQDRVHGVRLKPLGTIIQHPLSLINVVESLQFWVRPIVAGLVVDWVTLFKDEGMDVFSLHLY